MTGTLHRPATATRRTDAIALGVLLALATSLLWAGSRSYSIYLVHNPGFRVTREIFFRLGYGTPEQPTTIILITLIGLLVTAILAELTYRFCEAPMRQVGRELAARAAHRPGGVSLQASSAS